MFGEGAYKNFGPKLAPITDDPLPNLFKLQKDQQYKHGRVFHTKVCCFHIFSRVQTSVSKKILRIKKGT